MSSRSDNLNSDDYYMALAILTAKRSPDPGTQVGACIVNSSLGIVRTGFSDFPEGCADRFPWAREADNPLNTKYMYVVHAEANAILRASKPELVDARIFVTLFPCNECAKLVIQSGIKEVIYMTDKFEFMDSSKASKRMFDSAGIVYRQFNSTREKIEINLQVLN